MRCPPNSWPATATPLAALLLGSLAAVGGEARAQVDPAPGEVTAEPSSASIVALRRLVRHFDFEEGAVVAPDRLAQPFHRHLGDTANFPPFGRLGYADDHAGGGDWSFRFQLDGGSMAIRVPPAVLNVMPLGDYLVSAKVRTEGLVHARARLAAWLYDARGRLIPGSTVSSEVVRTQGRWTTISVEIHGRYEHAADLGLELQLVQPHEYLGADLPPDRPVLQDVHGLAWFDDVMVWHLPRIELTTGDPLNLIELPEPPALQVAVRDLTGELLTAWLRVYDLHGTLMHEQRFAAPRGRHPRNVTLPITRPGWYRAALDVQNDEGLGGRRTIDFWLLPSPDQSPRAPDPRFGVIIDGADPRRYTDVPRFVQSLRAGTVVLPVWEETWTGMPELDAEATIRAAAERLLNRRVEVVFALSGIPREPARRAGLDTHQLLELLAGDVQGWRPFLDELLARFGLDVRRWQIGRTGRDGLDDGTTLETRVARATTALGAAVPNARLILPVPADRTPPDPAVRAGFDVRVPYHVAPAAIEAQLEPWRGMDDLLVRLELLPAGAFTPHQRMTDLALRVLHGWRAGLPSMLIAAPWDHQVDEDGQVRYWPRAEFGVWATLAARLEGARFGGQFEWSRGVHCWILEGDADRPGALVAWTDDVTVAPPAIEILLADGPVRVTDITGAARSVPLHDGRHAITLGPAPVFIDGVSLELARFRESFGIEPDHVESVHRLHEHEVVLYNPWDTSVSGTVQLLDTDDWRITPRVHRFDIAPRARVRLPVNMVFARAAISGPKTIHAEIELVADRNYRFIARSDIELGMRDVDFAATWRVARNVQTGRLDLVVTQSVTNVGPRHLSLDLFLIGPDISRQRRPVAILPPGGAVTRTFRIPDGVALLAGRRLRVGAADRQGVGRLNYELAIPEALPTQALAPAP